MPKTKDDVLVVVAVVLRKGGIMFVRGRGLVYDGCGEGGHLKGGLGAMLAPSGPTDVSALRGG